MNIRRAVAEDFPAVRELIRQFPEQLMQEHLPDAEEFFVAEEGSPAEMGGRIIACCALEVYSKRLAEIRSLAVLPEHQGKGIASELINACLKAAKEQGVYEVISITGSPAFFEKLGFGTFNKEKYALIKIIG
ncbi:GNAT family N-acetyltransferase [Candidatus Kaiserbacteria bacterium]|nr:GNAT family N-acetyltransferase [Candidatus Kaiserbacteria bacterium]